MVVYDTASGEDLGEIDCEHVVNCGGLWAREVGRMVGLELPVLAMEHTYLVTEPLDEVIEYNRSTGRRLRHMIDFGGELYTRQEGQGMLLGTYEQACLPWAPRETPWDFSMKLLAPDLDRISPSLEVAFAHFPVLATAGIQRVVNGPFTFAPDGNPLIGPVRGLPGYWTACGVMAGLSQCGGVGLSVANWITEGDPGADVWAMGRGPLRRLRHPRLHESQGARELRPPVQDHLPERVPARGARGADVAHPRPAARCQRGVRRRLRAGVGAVVPGSGAGAGRGGDFRALQRLGPGAGRDAGRAGGCRHDGDHRVRQVPGVRSGGEGVGSTGCWPGGSRCRAGWRSRR